MHVALQHKIVDLLTKLLFPTQFISLLSKMSVHNIHTPS